jgi:hypothetical protein
MPDKIIPRGIKSLAANGVVIDRDWWLKVGSGEGGRAGGGGGWEGGSSSVASGALRKASPVQQQRALGV